MLWFRIGCLGALFCVCFAVALITGHVTSHHHASVSIAAPHSAREAAHQAPPARENTRVIDIRRADFERMSLAAVLGLGPGDQIEAINDQVAPSSIDLDFSGKEASNYIDISIRRRGERVRMIVLLH